MCSSKSTVLRLRTKHCKDVTSPMGGRPRVLTGQDERRIVHYITSREAESATVTAKCSLRDTGIKVGKGTVRTIRGILDQPAQSLHKLNYIENLQGILKKKKGKETQNAYKSPLSSLVKLHARVIKRWNQISFDFCSRLVESMPRRIRAVYYQSKWLVDKILRYDRASKSVCEQIPGQN